ncbi:MAG: hypothetical protein OXG78_17515 [Chloroflexi bacterium]|nr:hypothetical protein [Chloroflexota bacterium]
MVRFKYRFCKVLMARFVSGDLADPVRRRVARYIDECEDCYREYMNHREFAYRLEHSLATLGHPASAKLDQIWSSLQMDLRQPQTRPHSFPDFGSRSSLNFSYGLAIIAITVALLLPMIIGVQSSLFMIELPHLPRYAAIVRTPAVHSSQTVFVGATSQPNSRQLVPLLQNTPSPRF